MLFSQEGGEGVLGSVFATPSWSIPWLIIDSIFVTFGQICNFRDPNLVNFYLFYVRNLWRKKNTLFLTYTTNILSNTLNLTLEPCHCLTQHFMRSCHKCVRAQVTRKVLLYDRIAILKYSFVWLSRFCSLSVRLSSFHLCRKLSDCCLETHTTHSGTFANRKSENVWPGHSSYFIKNATPW